MQPHSTQQVHSLVLTPHRQPGYAPDRPSRFYTLSILVPKTSLQQHFGLKVHKWRGNHREGF